MSSLASTPCAQSLGSGSKRPTMMLHDRTGGPAFRTMDPRIAAACLFAPLALQKLHRAPATSQSVDGPCLRRDLRLLPSLPYSVFPDESGRGLKPRRQQWFVRSIVAVREGSLVPTQSLAASPRPRHNGPSRAGQPAPRLDVFFIRCLKTPRQAGSGPWIPMPP